MCLRQGRHPVDHGNPLNVGGGIPIQFLKAVHAKTFAFDIISAGVIERSDVSMIFGPDPRLENDSFVITLGK